MRTYSLGPPPETGGGGIQAAPLPASGRGRGMGPFGFTIIEVMVAMLIFAIAIVSIFGAQFSAIATTEFARNTTMATELARCRMSELELEFLQNGGFEEGDVTQSGPCCETLEGDENAENYTCTWEIKTIVLPDMTQMMSGTDGGLGGGMFGDLLGDSTGDSTGDDAMGGVGMDMMSAFLPTVTDLLEQAIRRVTVTVEWELSDGDKRDLSVVQFVTHPTQGPLQLLQQASATDQMAEQLGLGGEDQQAASPGNGKKQGVR
jgi:type II secretion system protein I